MERCKKRWRWAVSTVVCTTLLGVIGAPTAARAQATLIAHYTHDDCNWESTGTVADTVGGYDGSVRSTVDRDESATSGIKPDTCASADFEGGQYDVSGMSAPTSNGDYVSVSFWMYWDGTNSVTPWSWSWLNIWIYNGDIGLNTWNTDLYGISAAGMTNTWTHLVFVTQNRDPSDTKIYLNGTLQSASQIFGSPRINRWYASSSFAVGGWPGGSSYRYSGLIDEVKVYDGEMTQAQVDADYAAVTASCGSCGGGSGATKVASYDFEGDWDSSGTLEDILGSADGSVSGSVSKVPAGASGSKPATCNAADFGGGEIDLYGLPVSTTAGAETSVTFWMRWDGGENEIPIGFYRHGLWFFGGSVGFNSWRSDIWGISSSGMANTWKHVGLVFVNGDVQSERMWIDGVEQTLSQQRNSPRDSNAYVQSQMVVGGVSGSGSSRFGGEIDNVNVYTGAITDAQVAADMAEVCDTQLVEYEMEQSSWSSSAGEVIDSSSNGYDATAVAGPSTAGRDPALSGDPGTCQYGDFDGADDYIQLPGSVPNLTSDFTIAAWIRPTATAEDGRIFADDQSNSGGYAFSLGDGGDNRLRFFSRSVSPVSVDTLSAPVSEDSWFHVVAVHDASARTRQIYVNGVAQTLTGGTTTPTYSGSWGTDSGPASIGGETSASSESSARFYFQGQIDEVNVYESALNPAQIATLYAETHACSVVAGVDHFDIDFGTSNASTCAPKSVTITACANSDCSSTLTTYAGTIQLTTSSQHGTWAIGSGNGTLSPNPDTTDDGAASYAFSLSDNGSVELMLSNAHADDLMITANDTTEAVSSTSSTVSFSNNAFVITPDPIQVAGRDQSNTVTLWQRNGSDCTVATGYTGTKSLKAWLTRDADDAGGVAPTIDASEVPETASTAFQVDFTNGVATVTLATSDVGRYILHLRDDSRSFATGVDIESDSVTLTTRPFGLDIDVVDAGGGANPGASGSGGAVFTRAGAAFRVSVRAVLWQAADDSDDDGIPDGHLDGNPAIGANLDDNGATVSFGAEASADSVVLAGALVLPAGGNDPGLLGSPIASFASGAGSTSDAVFDEVGIIEITADLADDSYLGSGNVVGASGYVGRFVPDHFQLSGTALRNRRDPATQASCAASFTFLDERLELEFDLAARNASGATTLNYTGSFAKLTSVSSLGGSSGVSTDAINLVGSDGGNVYTPADRFSGTTPTVAISNGATASTVVVSFEMDRLDSGGLVPETPFSGMQLVINPTDSDGVETNGATLLTMPGGPQNFTPVGTTTFYFGRIVVENAHGSELTPVPVWLHTEYCAAVDGTPACTQWADLSRNVSNDDCSRLTPTAPTDTSIADIWQGGTAYGAGSEALFQVYDAVQNRGGGGFRMSYTGSGDGIQVTVPELGADSVETFHDYLLLQPGIVTFGIYKGRDPVIYMRESY